MIRAEGLTKRFGNNLAVDNLDLEIPRGEVFGFLGPNGSGKTTTVRMLASLIAPTAGAAWVNGHQIGVADAAVRASVGLLTEAPGLYPRLTAVENLGVYTGLHGVADDKGQIAKYLKLLDLWERRDEPVGGFSKGMQQKLAIARALLHEPPILFMDEPTAALDPEASRVVRDFIAELRGEGRTIFLCTHNLDEADRLCDRVAVIRQRLIRVDTPANLRQGLYGRSVRVRLAQVTPEAQAMVAALPFVRGVAPLNGGLRVAMDRPEEHNPSLVRALVAAGAAVQYIEEEEHSLEQVYFDLLREDREASS